MSFNLDDVNIGGQLKVGTGIVPAVKEGDERINGSMYAEGPVVFGGPTEFPDNKATLMVGRTKNNDKDCEPADRSLHVRGNSYLEGDDGTRDALFVTQGSTQHGVHVVGGGIGNEALYINGSVFVTGTVDCLSTGRLEARHVVADGRPKPFDIPHPSRENHRLRYACIEGPEVGVYVRGRVKNEKVIILPKYWKNLVHEDSITVQLQPIGAHQDIIVKRWDDEKIYLQSKGGMPINCFYHVYAERKDINPLIVEYEGEECFDYPDPNYKPGAENPVYNDPQFAGPPNTITK